MVGEVRIVIEVGNLAGQAPFVKRAESVGLYDPVGDVVEGLLDAEWRAERLALALVDPDCSEFTGPLVDVLEQMPMDRSQMAEIIGPWNQILVGSQLRQPRLDEVVLGVAQLLDSGRVNLFAEHPGVGREQVPGPALLSVASLPGPWRIRVRQGWV